MNPALIIAMVDAALRLIEKIGPAVAALKQNAELTPEQEAELDTKIVRLTSMEHWKINQ